MATSTLVFWMQDEKTSIVSTSAVPESDREPGKIASVVWDDGISYPAQILKTAKCMKTLEAAEKKFLEKYNALTSDKPGRAAKSSRSASSATVASAIEIARSLGEKVQLPPKQAAERAAAQREKRVNNANVKQVESKGDTVAFKSNNVSKVKRNLGCDFQISEGGTDEEDGGNGVFPGLNSKLDESINSPLKVSLLTVDTPVKKDSCDRCKALAFQINHTSMEFLTALSKFCNVPEPISNLDYSSVPTSSASDEGRLRPLPVEAGHKKVELTAGSGIFLKKSDKTMAVFSSSGDPDKLTREILNALYGDKLKQPGISAMGHGKSKMGIGETDLKNIYSFVCRNAKVNDRTDGKGDALPSFNYIAFVKAVNKRLKTASRNRANEMSSSSHKKTKSSSATDSAVHASQESLITSPPPATPTSKHFTPSFGTPSEHSSPRIETSAPQHNSGFRTPAPQHLDHSGFRSPAPPQHHWGFQSSAAQHHHHPGYQAPASEHHHPGYQTPASEHHSSGLHTLHHNPSSIQLNSPYAIPSHSASHYQHHPAEQDNYSNHMSAFLLATKVLQDIEN